MHDGEFEDEEEEVEEEVLEAGGGVGKLVDSDDSDSCDLSELGMRMLFVSPAVPRRGATGTAADGERFFARRQITKSKKQCS